MELKTIEDICVAVVTAMFLVVSTTVLAGVVGAWLGVSPLAVVAAPLLFVGGFVLGRRAFSS